jgi:hypothetical protein
MLRNVCWSSRSRSRASHPCVHRVLPGKGGYPSHGGLSIGPKTAAGTARIAAVQKARWERFRQQHGHDPEPLLDA